MDVLSTGSTVHVSTGNNLTRVEHPLDPLTPDEINVVTLTIRRYTAEHTDIRAVNFNNCALLPPPKRAVLASLGIPISPGGKPETPGKLVRKAVSDFFDVLNGVAYNVVLALEDEEWKVESLQRLPEGTQPQITVEELINCEFVVRSDAKVQALAKEVGVEPHQIFADGWAIGWDDRFPKGQRLQQALLFARFSQHDNLYAHPLDFIPVIDSLARKVLHIDFPPSWKKKSGGSVAPCPETDPSLVQPADFTLSLFLFCHGIDHILRNKLPTRACLVLIYYFRLPETFSIVRSRATFLRDIGYNSHHSALSLHVPPTKQSSIYV